MAEFPASIHGYPNLCGSESQIDAALGRPSDGPLYYDPSAGDLSRFRATCAVALHMHQPLTPSGGDDLQAAAMIGNLQYMMEHPGIGDNHNAAAFQGCYQRMGEIVPQLLAEGKRPRAMLDYSGTLFHGLVQMGAHEVFDTLRRLVDEPAHARAVEWLATPWGHAVAPSTPVADFRLHVQAWQHHFAAIFGLSAMARVKGFSPSEMALPNHPDVAYAFVKTLKDRGFRWVLVQEHTVEEPSTGRGPSRKHVPHRLEVVNSQGERTSIVAIIKTQGSDTKLVGQMQPYYEAKSLQRETLAGHAIPPIVTQIADGENGGVMMNEFPSKYMSVVAESADSDTALVNVTEYLEFLDSRGITEADLPALQPLFQSRIWESFKPGEGNEKLQRVISSLKAQDSRFHMDGGSWTDDISWVRGYDDVLGPMEEISVLFHEKVVSRGVPTHEDRYRNVLYHLLVSQTSCYRYWGQGLWTDYGKEVCRRTRDILTHDF